MLRQLHPQNNSLIGFVPRCANCTNVRPFVEHTIKACSTILESWNENETAIIFGQYIQCTVDVLVEGAEKHDGMRRYSML